MAAQKQVVVRRYGLREPLDWGDDCDQQLFLMNQLWNSLVEIERHHRKAYFDLMKEDRAVAELSEKIEVLNQEKQQILTERNSLRRKYQTRKAPGTAPLDERLREISVNLRELSITAKEKRAKARKQLRPQMEALTRQRLTAAKEARRNSGLWWGNYNAVCRGYEFARRRVWQRGGELHFRSFDGSGRFVNQIQGGMPVEKLFDGSHSQVKIIPLPIDAYSHPSRGERRRQQRTELTICVYTGVNEAGKRYRRTLTFPMIMHRPLPDNAVIKEVFVRRYRQGTDLNWSATITATCTGVVDGKHEGRHACGVDLGWRKVEDGLRVATIVGSDDEARYVVLPKAILQKLDYVDELRGRIYQAANEIRTWLVEMLDQLDGLPEVINSCVNSLHKHGQASQRALVRLALLWRDACPGFEKDIYERLEQWRKNDKRWRNEMDNLRTKALARRADFYRNEAKRIAREFAIIGLEELDLRRFAKRATNGEENNQFVTKIRLNRERAALSELRKWIEIQAAKHAAEIVQCSGESTLLCHCCGHVNTSTSKRWKDIVWQCEACGVEWDQDVNAGYNIRNWVMGSDVKLEEKAEFFNKAVTVPEELAAALHTG